MQNGEFILGLDELGAFAAGCVRDGVVLLRGELAMGKTAFADAVARSRGAVGAASPTFSLMNELACADGGRIFHYDLYRCGLDGARQNGLFENLFERGLHLVEWGDDALAGALRRYGLAVVTIEIAPAPEPAKRRYIVRGAE